MFWRWSTSTRGADALQHRRGRPGRSQDRATGARGLPRCRRCRGAAALRAGRVGRGIDAEDFRKSRSGAADMADGSTVAIAGFGVGHSYPNSLVIALRDTGVRDLCIVANSLGAEATSGRRSWCRTIRSSGWFYPSRPGPACRRRRRQRLPRAKSSWSWCRKEYWSSGCARRARGFRPLQPGDGRHAFAGRQGAAPFR